MRSHWDFVDPVPWSGVSQGIAFIRDLDGPVSVTNDAENVLAYIQQQWPNTCSRVVYQGTDGEWWEIYWDPNIEFTARFRPWNGLVWDKLTKVEE